MSVMPVPDPAVPDHRFPRFVGLVAWLERHRTPVLVLAAAAIAGALLLDIAIPSYPIAGFYLVPITLAALTLRVRFTLVVSLICLGLAIYVAAVQGRTDGPTITVVCFSVLSGAGLIALAYLVKQVGRLYETERATTERLESLATQLQTLQEVVVLDSDRPLSDLLGRVIEQGSQLLGSDGCCVCHLDSESHVLIVSAATGMAPHAGDVMPLADSQDPISRALADRQPVAVSDNRSDGAAAPFRRTSGPAAGALLAVPLLVRQEPYGVMALSYREPRPFTDVDVRLAASFGGQVALAIENARLRDEAEQNAVAGERSRLARDLHDSVTQSLFAATLKAEAVRRRWRPVSAEARRHVEDMERLTRGALAEMRTLLLEMRPQALAESSLRALLEQLAAATEGRTAIEVELTVTGARQLPPDVTVTLYRIAQEALHNMEHHAGARSAWVMLDLSAPDVRLVVGDDGRGFDVASVPTERLGLRIMRERAEAAGVRLCVRSEDGDGTVVTAEWSDAGQDC